MNRVTIFRSSAGGWTVRYGQKATGETVAARDLEEAFDVIRAAYDKDGKAK